MYFKNFLNKKSVSSYEVFLDVKKEKFDSPPKGEELITVKDLGEWAVKELKEHDYFLVKMQEPCCKWDCSFDKVYCSFHEIFLDIAISCLGKKAVEKELNRKIEWK